MTNELLNSVLYEHVALNAVIAIELMMTARTSLPIADARL